MLYSIVRPFATIAFKFYFKKIRLENAEALPKDKPIFIASNHPTAFIEPCLLACFLPKPLHFFVKGELFKKPFYNKLMDGIHLIPIYRRTDGEQNPEEKNRSIFKYCYDALAQNKAMLIMPEGSTKQVKRLRPLKKGLARMCFGAIEETPGLDVQILPIGTNFTYADKPRTDAMIKVGTPIRVLDFWDEYVENPNRAVRNLTQKVYEDMKATIIHVEDEEDDLLAEQLFSMARAEQTEGVFPIMNKDPQPLEREQKIARQINALPSDKKESLKKLTGEYFEKLKKFDLKEGFSGFQNTGWGYLFLILGFLPALFGTLFHFPVTALAARIRNKRVKQLEFKQPIWLGIVIVLMPFYYFLWAVAGIFIVKKRFWIALTLMPAAGLISLIYRDLYISFKNRMKFLKLTENAKVDLLGMRERIFEQLQ